MSLVRPVFGFIARIWRAGCLGKIAVSFVAGFVSLILLGLALPDPPAQSAAPAPTAAPLRQVALDVAPTRPPRAPAVPTSTPAPTATSAPTATPEPTMMPAPTALPTATAVPTIAPEPVIQAPAAPPSGPTFNGKTVSPKWWPCSEGQMKGNRDSGIYHPPSGQSYAKTYEGVDCFDTATQAEAAGYRRAKR